MDPEQRDRGTESRELGGLAPRSLEPTATDPIYAGNHQTHDGYVPRTDENPSRKVLISIGLIDEKSFTRECISRSPQAVDHRFTVGSFVTCEDYLEYAGGDDIVLYHTHEATANWDINNQWVLSLKRLIKIVPVIILSDIDSPDALIEIFESGVRGFIPTNGTTLEQITEIIGLVRAGGVFVPLSGLSLQKRKEPTIKTNLVSSSQFTAKELVILDRLKFGKANKIIAHELGVSESTVKMHIGKIMKKLKVTNRTQAVSRALTLSAADVV